jgi:endo-1,4-beta-xylanase
MVLSVPSCHLIVERSFAADQDARTLKGAFHDNFIMGVAIYGKRLIEEDPKLRNLATVQFNSVSSRDMLKWFMFNPNPEEYGHELADRYVEFGNSHDMYVVGHVLFWHEATPAWVWEDCRGEPLPRDALLDRMRGRVRHVSDRYGDRIDAWDVVNESIMEDGTLRKSPWTKILGSDFNEQAFRIADAELPDDVELLYNDYNMTFPHKRDAVVRMIQDLKQKGLRIDGVGMQAHWDLDRPSIQQIENSILAFHRAEVDVHITELDIDVLPRGRGKPSPENNPYVDGLPTEMQEKLAERYVEIFRLFLKHEEKIKRVTFWGVCDQHSFRNIHPIKGRTNHPLLFDRQGNPKPAFHSVLNLAAP